MYVRVHTVTVRLFIRSLLKNRVNQGDYVKLVFNYNSATSLLREKCGIMVGICEEHCGR